MKPMKCDVLILVFLFKNQSGNCAFATVHEHPEKVDFFLNYTEWNGNYEVTSIGFESTLASTSLKPLPEIM